MIGANAGIAPDTVLYLAPHELIDAGRAASAGPGDRRGTLAGGPLAFSRLRLSWRRPGDVARHAVLGLDDFEAWARARDGDALGARAEETFARLSARRAPWAGLALDRPLVMGVVNVTPDSFSDGGRFLDRQAAIDAGRRQHEAGADVIDIGGESTRPGSDPVAVDEELRRVVPVIEGLAGVPVPLSIDTRRARVMREALAAGARIVNDVSALSHDPEALATVAAAQAPVVLMHSLGEPKTMQRDPAYVDCVYDIYDYLEARIAACLAAGIARDRVLVDPGIGFGKTVAHNVALLRGLATYHGLGCGVMVGVSHKSFIAALSAGEPADRRVPGSLAAALWALGAGAQAIRVHDVAETRQAVQVWRALALARAQESAGSR
ncbi:MAG: dihydropteroate synthase [Alphaproteobacteria bacterium]|nr:dihydropteroate synthase [Alphaproteobacteria bacterium]